MAVFSPVAGCDVAVLEAAAEEDAAGFAPQAVSALTVSTADRVRAANFFCFFHMYVPPQNIVSQAVMRVPVSVALL